MVARRAHNPKVVGSNPTPATMSILDIACKARQPVIFKLIKHPYLFEK